MGECDECGERWIWPHEDSDIDWDHCPRCGAGSGSSASMGECDECGERWSWPHEDSDIDWDHCPRCGADLD